MRKVYLSFLGTNNYVSCNYNRESRESVRDVHFIQEATVSWHCREWNEKDQIMIFATNESRIKNWLDNGHDNERDEADGQCEGLQQRLARLNLSAEVKVVPIPSGKFEQEIWEIFTIMIGELQDGDHLYLDITHAFRSLPLLATVVVNYAKIIKNIQVKAIDYGAMEAVGSALEVKNMDSKDRNIPVFNLLPFDQLLDWSMAIDRFITSGDAVGIQELTTQNVILRKKEVRGPDKDADGLKKMANALGNFSRTMTTCRGKTISTDADRLKNAIRMVADQQLVKPLNPLLDKLETTITGFKGEEVIDGIAACQWCLNHNLIQQGFTILQETMCTCILSHATNEDSSEKTKRNLVGIAVKIERCQLPFDDWNATAQKHQEIVEKIRLWLRNNDDLLKCMANLSKDRNDLNHAGMNECPMKADKFSENLKKYIKIFEKESTTR